MATSIHWAAGRTVSPDCSVEETAAVLGPSCNATSRGFLTNVTLNYVFSILMGGHHPLLTRKCRVGKRNCREGGWLSLQNCSSQWCGFKRKEQIEGDEMTKQDWQAIRTGFASRRRLCWGGGSRHSTAGLSN
jgi:hypothetical protein